MDKKSLYTKAYKMLDKSTPLRIDCGTLCDKACCKSLDADTGMYLFPGEETIYSQAPDFIAIKPSSFSAGGESSVLLAVCSGVCVRELRPLACRIFPLTPYITENDILTIKMDPRAGLLCPLARYSDRKSLNQDFVKNVRSVFQMLLEDPDIKQYIVHLSRMLDEFGQDPLFKLK